MQRSSSTIAHIQEDARPDADKALNTSKWLIRMRKHQRQEHHDGEIWQSLTEALQALERFRSQDSTLKHATSVLLATQFMTAWRVSLLVAP
jgi:hypothetical protein